MKATHKEAMKILKESEGFLLITSHDGKYVRSTWGIKDGKEVPNYPMIIWAMETEKQDIINRALNRYNDALRNKVGVIQCEDKKKRSKKK